jgi:hypothetical protein
VCLCVAHLCNSGQRARPEPEMIEIIMMQAAIILLLLWVLALMMGRTFGGLTHVLLVVAVVLLVLRMARGRSVLRRG